MTCQLWMIIYANWNTHTCTFCLLICMSAVLSPSLECFYAYADVVIAVNYLYLHCKRHKQWNKHSMQYIWWSNFFNAYEYIFLASTYLGHTTTFTQFPAFVKKINKNLNKNTIQISNKPFMFNMWQNFINKYHSSDIIFWFKVSYKYRLLTLLTRVNMTNTFGAKKRRLNCTYYTTKLFWLPLIYLLWSLSVYKTTKLWRKS